MKETELKEMVESFAFANGYDDYEFERIWKESIIYRVWKKEDEGAYVGYPIFIIITDGKVSFATPYDTDNIMGFSLVDTNHKENGFTI